MAKNTDAKKTPKASKNTKVEAPEGVNTEGLTDEQVQEAIALKKRQEELLAQNSELKKRRATAQTRVKRGLTRQEELQKELDEALKGQTPEAIKAQILELEGENASLEKEVPKAEKQADTIRASIDATEREIRVAKGLPAEPEQKQKKDGKPRVVNTLALQKAALQRALENRGFVISEDKLEASNGGYIVRFSDMAVVAGPDGNVNEIAYGKGAIQTIEELIPGIKPQKVAQS